MSVDNIPCSTSQAEDPLTSPIESDDNKLCQKYQTICNIPIVHFERGQRKDDIAARMRKKNPVKDGVVFIGIAQEKAYAFKGRKKSQRGYVGFDYSRQSLQRE